MMGPLDIFLAKLTPEVAITEMEVGQYHRVVAINRTMGTFVFEVQEPTYRRLGVLDFIFGREPQAVILVKR
ncbi:MAG: hypothetical protein V4641_09810 [Pseudomonadota bacterium]